MSEAGCDRLAIVGNSGGTNIGQSLLRASPALGRSPIFFDAHEAWRGPRIVRALTWRLMGRRPPRLGSFSRRTLTQCEQQLPTTLIATGMAPLTATVVEALRRRGIRCINYSTDDPWNKTQRAAWHLQALPQYDIVFSTRRANIDDFRALGCRDVRYLPFAYDDELFASVREPEAAPAHDVLFVGGADRDRAEFMTAFMRHGPPPTLVGDYWSRYSQLAACSLGPKKPAELRALTAAAGVNICLVRRANRDGHVMRSFEIPACCGFLLAEDTPEHRGIFGAEGENVLYFKTPEDAAAKTRWALAKPAERSRMAAAAHALIAKGQHTYRDRLMSILNVAAEYGQKT